MPRAPSNHVLDAIPSDVTHICRRLRDGGHRGWVVGGCVRDLLRGAPAKDWDIATDAAPERVMRMFRRVIPTGIQHGTVTVMVRGVGYEVTTLRGEGDYVDGRRPASVVFLDDIEEDLARRDFTFNAIAIEPLAGDLIDPFDGARDLAARCLRAVGDPEARFREDGLRILRAARFAATLECEVAPATREAMGADAPLATLARVSAERVHDEWLKTMTAAKPSQGFALLCACGAMGVVAPELAAIGDDALDRSLATVDRLDDPILRVAALLMFVAEPEAVLGRLKFSRAHQTRITLAIRHHDLDPDLSGADLRRWLATVSKPHVDDAFDLALARATSENRPAVARARARARAELEAGVPLTTRDLAVRGRDLMHALEVAPGPHVGELLNHLLEVCLRDPAQNERARLLEHAAADRARRAP